MFTDQHACKRGRLQDPPRELSSADKMRHIFGIRKIITLEQGQSGRIGAFEPDFPTRLRTQLAGLHGQPMHRRHRLVELAAYDRHERDARVASPIAVEIEKSPPASTTFEVTKPVRKKYHCRKFLSPLKPCA